jgi:uncharacterized surface protein with fasciclin (FAS1) repeats
MRTALYAAELELDAESPKKIMQNDNNNADLAVSHLVSTKSSPAASVPSPGYDDGCGRRGRLAEDVTMKKLIRVAVIAAGAGLIAPVAISHARADSMPNTVMVGGMAMYPNKTIVANAVNSADHTTLVAAVKAAGLVGALSGPGPFTVFAPTNEAFNDLPAGTVATLVKPENKATLTKILTYHVVPGDYNTTKLRAMILAGGGQTQLKTLEGEPLTFMMNGSSNIMVIDAKGDKADITVADVTQSNGVIQVIDKVLLP